jgi:cytochrome c-type biogenesis protein CcmE
MNLKAVLALTMVVLAVVIGVSSFNKTVTPYISFAEARRSSGLVQVTGVLADKQYVMKQQEQFLSFRLRDARGEVLPIEYHGVIPGNFDQATSIVAIGRYHDGKFTAEQLLVKCPSKYQAEAEKAGGAS